MPPEMGTETRKAALLVDWENLRGALTRSKKDAGKQQIRTLVAAVDKLAAGYGASLNYSTAFMAHTSLQAEAPLLRAGGLEIELSGVAKNAADTKLIVTVMRLCLRQGYSVFFLVSGDVDYVELAVGVQVEGATCVLMPLDDKNLRSELRNFELKEYVSDYVDFPDAAEVPVDDLKLFALHLQALAFEKGSIGFRSAQDRLSPRLAGGADGFEANWNTLQSHPSRALSWLMPRTSVPGRDRPIGRLRYENPEVLRLLLCIDAILERADRQNGCTVSDVVNMLAYETLEPRRDHVLGLISTAEKAGLVVQVGERITLATNAGAGYLLPICHMVLYAWGLAVNRGWSTVGRGALGGSWANYRSRRGSDSGAHAALKTEGIDIARAAHHAGVLDELVDGGTRGLIPRWDHPLASFTKETVERIILRTSQLTADQATVSYDVLVTDLSSAAQRTRLAPAASQVERWLRVLARERHLTAFEQEGQGRLVQLRADSKLTQNICARKSP